MPSGASTRQLPLPLRLPPPHLHPRSAGPSFRPGSSSFFLSSGEQEAKKGRERGEGVSTAIARIFMFMPPPPSLPCLLFGCAVWGRGYGFVAQYNTSGRRPIALGDVGNSLDCFQRGACLNGGRERERGDLHCSLVCPPLIKLSDITFCIP